MLAAQFATGLRASAHGEWRGGNNRPTRYSVSATSVATDCGRLKLGVAYWITNQLMVADATSGDCPLRMRPDFTIAFICFIY